MLKEEVNIQVEDDSGELVDWLMRYGYLPPPDPSTGQLQAWTAVTHAVKSMQRFAGLMETGVVGGATWTASQSAPRREELVEEEEEDGWFDLDPAEHQLEVDLN
ncbi:unnamed protein product [Arctogadus glacialis]